MTTKFKNLYFVLIPNEANVLSKIHKIDNLADIVSKYGNERVVIGCKTPKMIDKTFIKCLLSMKEAIACVAKTTLKGNSCMLFKLKNDVT
jgi:hypothetical protein